MAILNNDWLYLLRLAWEIFAPRRCAVCGREIHNGIFCQVCREHFVLQKLLEQQEGLQAVHLLFKYTGQLRDCLRALKFQHDTKYIRPLQEEAELCMNADGWQEFCCQYDVICPVPTAGSRRQQRGFDVPELLFQFLPESKLRRVLRRVRNTAPLYNLTGLERRKELTGCFCCNGNVRGLRILLVDDIYTTGATAEEAARTLAAGGAACVDMLAFSAGKNNF